ncbi:Ger(x)C family spore germination protein [Bacillus sp. JJ1764]|uniref:Ger(x)C family spore germination protein n=1 Tax=Bacillus sp. JJ1764 TaxID=3122964 RepID=UPI0030006B96
MIKHDLGSTRCFLLSFILCISSFTLTGCWSSREANDLAILNVVGIDKNEAGQFELTALIPKPENRPYQSTSGSTKDKELILTSKGRSLLESMSLLASSLSKEIYLGHVQVVIFGEKAASESMKESLDFLRRENGFRPNIKLLITKGKASDIINKPTQLKNPLGSEIVTFTKTKRRTMSSMVQNLSQFTEDLSMKMKDPFTGEISAAGDEGIQLEQVVSGKNYVKDASSQDSQKKDSDMKQNTDTFSIQGTAVFKRDHLIGWLDKDETRGVLWVNGKLKNDVVILSCPNDDSGTISLQINQTSSESTPRIVNGKPKMSVTIKVDGDIGQITCQNVNLSSDEMEKINMKLKDKIKQEVNHTFVKVKQEWQADVFYFGESIYRKYPNEWKDISSGWRSGGLKEMPVQMKVITNISRYGLRER